MEQNGRAWRVERTSSRHESILLNTFTGLAATKQSRHVAGQLSRNQALLESGRGPLPLRLQLTSHCRITAPLRPHPTQQQPHRARAAGSLSSAGGCQGLG